MNRDERDNKAELSLLATTHELSAGAKRDFCVSIDLPWEEYLRLQRKWSRVLTRWEMEKQKETHANS